MTRDTKTQIPIDEIIDCYIADHRKPAAREMDTFRIHVTDKQAVERAALARLVTGKRHPHQRRIPRAALDESRRLLGMNLKKIRSARSFDDLYGLICRLIAHVPGIGELTIYDTSLRIAAHFGLEPTKVYLHAGTRAGARALGIDARTGVLEMHDLPLAFSRLKPREVEDALCIYKTDFRRSVSPKESVGKASSCRVMSATVASCHP